ncbi:IclR family transcriptional regulator [Nocardioides bruguierae]|uniref:IclR family transcriptional regulator n=1 Tax=Nocardioides bruguierae TaxID=2945102 RepID=A0A9X2IGG6_9ACTN|nr:IclR family transcriptional regulator [Nocardioides bruguierae]MCL8026204.1 IclR family transcriptional regulator [Nocardioides bruguierae]MCM0621549.1 IclR family transcriptional regulator [Nocardioides bruguierae]
MDTPVDGVGRTAAVLRALAGAEPDGAGTSALARAAGLPRATTHRLLTALAETGLADRDPGTGDWHVGPELYLLGAAAARRYDVTALAQPFVRRLADATGESAFFSVRRGEETVCLVREDGSFPLRSHVLHEGSRFPLGVVSAGIAVLAHLPEDEIDDYLSRVDLVAEHGEQHAPAPLRALLERTRREGWATNPGLVVRGSWGMAAAVFDLHERPVAALSLTGVEHRFEDARRPELGRLLLREAHALTERMRRRG